MSFSVEIGDYFKDCNNAGVKEYIKPVTKKLEEYLEASKGYRKIKRQSAESTLYDSVVKMLYESNLNGSTERYVMDNYKITTDLEEFVSTVKSIESCDRVYAVLDVVGLQVRAYYSNGMFWKATIRGVGEIVYDVTEELEGLFAEKAILQIDKFSEIESLELDIKIVSEVSTIEEYRGVMECIISLLNSEQYKELSIVVEDLYSEEVEFKSIYEKLNYLAYECGFEIPLNWELEGVSEEYNLSDSIQELTIDIEESYMDNEYNYVCNGVRWYTDIEYGLQYLLKIYDEVVFEDTIESIDYINRGGVLAPVLNLESGSSEFCVNISEIILSTPLCLLLYGKTVGSRIKYMCSEVFDLMPFTDEGEIMFMEIIQKELLFADD